MYDYKWEKEFEEKIKVNRKNKLLLRDIPITEIEFNKMIEIIKFDVKGEYLNEKKESFILARFLVEIGYRKYDENMFWDFVFDALNLDKLPKYQVMISELFYKTLKKNNFVYMKTGKKYVSSVLINTYVPKNYLESFYKFLQSFYIKELSQTFDSDLILLTIDELQNYLENEDENKINQSNLNDKPSTFYLLSTVKKSIYLNKENFKEYLYNYLEVLDSYWWTNSEKKELKFKEEEEIFYEWFHREINVRERKFLKKVEKQYKNPTITLGINNNLNLYIPRQKIMNIAEYKEPIFYKIKLKKEVILKGKLNAFSSFDKVMIEQEKIFLNDFYYNADLILESMGIELKKFKLFENPFIIFDQNNENISLTNLRDNTDYKIYSNKEILLIDTDQEIFLKSGVNIFKYNENNNYRIIVDNKEYFLGKIPPFKILDNKENNYSINEKNYINIYKEFPRIFIKTDMDSSMIRIDLNNKKYKLLELNGTYKEENEGFILDLKKIFFKDYGELEVKIIELQENKEIFKDNFFILNFEIKFNKKEYIFEKEALIFIDKKQDVLIEHNYKQDNENYEIKIPLINTSNIRFKIKENILNCKIPILKWRLKKNQEWKYENLIFWHEDFKEEIEIFIPNTKIAKMQLENYKTIESKKLKNYFIFDLNKFLDEFRINEQNFYNIKLLLDDQEIIFGKVIYKNYIKNIGIGYQKNAQKILGQFEFYGKGEYFIDIINKKNQSHRILSKIIKEVVVNELININYLLDYDNYIIKIGCYEGIKNKFFNNKERSERILYESKLYEIDIEEKIEDRLYTENIIQIYKCLSNKKNYFIKSFYIKDIEQINKNLYKGQAFYTLKDGSLRYFSYNNPFEFKVNKIDKEDGIISELFDKNQEVPILDSYYKQLKTDEPNEDKNNYERWLIPDEYRFKIVGGE